MKNLCMSVIVIFGSLFSGCASGLIGTLPEVIDKNNASEIFIIRPYNFVASGTSAYISFDNNDIFAIRTVQYARFIAPPGNHTIGVRYPGFPANNIEILLTPKGKYYFGVSVGFSNFSLVQKTEEEALPYIETSNYMPLDDNRK